MAGAFFNGFPRIPILGFNPYSWVKNMIHTLLQP